MASASAAAFRSTVSTASPSGLTPKFGPQPTRIPPPTTRRRNPITAYRMRLRFPEDLGLRMSDTYTNVDASHSPTEALHWQQKVNALPAIQAYKQRTYELLGAGLILDVGVGPGDDAVALGAERCLGFDLAMTMCDAAAKRGISVAQADGRQLPVASNSFDGVRSDRVIQHIPEPDTAIAEMIRVVKPGGRLVLSDPDQQTLSINVPGVAPELTDEVRRLRRDVGYLNGRIASSYPERLGMLGLADITVAGFPLFFTDPQAAFGLSQWPRIWRDRGVGSFAEQQILDWEQALTRTQPGFLFSLTYLVVSGVKPPPRFR